MRKISVILCAAILIILGCTQKNANQKDRDIPGAVNKPVYFMAGRIEARNKVDITSSISARVLKITKRVGDHVDTGEVLLTLDRKEVQTQLQSVQKNFDNAQLNLDRASNLNGKGYISGQQQEILEYQLKQAKAALDLAKIQFENGTVNSPIDGVISDVKVNVGETPSANSILLSIVNASHIYVKAFIPENMLQKVAVGMKVVMQVSEISNHIYHGRITVVDPVVDSKSKTILVNIEALDFDADVKPGMTVLVGMDDNGSSNQ